MIELKHKVKQYLHRRFNVSFSKSGDDIQLQKLLKFNNPGVYLDIGCWHPVKASNTYYFYLRGWKGICIDPNPSLQKLYQKFRPSDIFLNYAIASGDDAMTYHILSDKYSSMNTLDSGFIKRKNLEDEIRKKIQVPVYSIEKVLDEQLHENDRLDFFDVDVEGLDMEVLKTNNWKKYRPKILMVETNLNIKNDVNSDLTEFLDSKNYNLVAKSVISGNLGNLFFIDNYMM